VDQHACLLRRDLPVTLPVRSNEVFRLLIVWTISSVVPVSQSVSQSSDKPSSERKTRTRELRVLRLELIPFVAAVAMHDEAERGGGRLSGLARIEAVDVVRRRLAVIKDRLGCLVRSRHDLSSQTHIKSEKRKKKRERKG
jgi:hypothetical protein